MKKVVLNNEDADKNLEKMKELQRQELTLLERL